MDPSHPPLDFPFYGLPDSWQGTRWLHNAEGRLGHPVDGIWLRHGSAARRDAEHPWLRVGTLRGDRHRGPSSREASTAHKALFTLVDTAMPSPDERPDGYLDRIVGFAAEQADRHAGWPVVRWTLDGVPTTASVLRWAGAWAAFAVLAEVDLAVVGHGTEPDGLALAEVVDSSGYHFDHRERLFWPDTFERAWDAAGIRTSDDEESVWWPAHEDHAGAMT